MINSNLLKSAIVRTGMADYEVAEKIGISKSSISRKINGTCEFKMSEFEKLVQLLNLSPDETMAIFFGGKRCLTEKD